MKFEALVGHLRDRISSGKYAPGQRVPSENELAHQFKVSRPTAARALRELSTAGIVQRKAGSGTYVSQKSTSTPDPLRFGLLMPGLRDTEVFEPICNAITRFAQSRNAVVWWGSPGDVGEIDSATADALCDQYVKARVRGVFFAPREHGPDRERANQLIVSRMTAAGIAVVLLDRDVTEFPARSCYDLVALDNWQAGFLIAKHVIGKGRRPLRFAARPGWPSSTDLRLAGCREAAARHGVALEEDWIHAGDPADDRFAKALIRGAGPKVIICSNDGTAALLLQTFTRLGIRLPQSVAIVGFDDVNYSTLLAVPLTTIRQPFRDIGRAAVQTMLDRLADPTLPPRQILLTGELIVRDSCGA